MRHFIITGKPCNGIPGVGRRNSDTQNMIWDGSPVSFLTHCYGVVRSYSEWLFWRSLRCRCLCRWGAACIIRSLHGIWLKPFSFILFCLGWLCIQSMGTARPPYHWSLIGFKSTELGSKWALWASSHQLGAMAIFLGLGTCDQYFGWRAAFIIPSFLLPWTLLSFIQSPARYTKES